MNEAVQTAMRPVWMWIALAAIGVAWGSTQLFSKLIVEGGHHPVGITFLATLLAAVLMAAHRIVTRKPLPLSPRYLVFYAVAGALGTAIPNIMGYEAMKHLQVGVVSVVMALVPIMTMLVALILRMDRAEPLRLVGLALGTGSILLLVIPEASLPSPDQAIWIALPVLTCLSYTMENIYIARSRPADLDPMQVMCGFFWAALIMLLPVVAVSGTWMPVGRFDLAEISLVAMTFAHIFAYTGFVWLIAHAGPVFAAQVAYIVTLTGVFLGIVVLGEVHSDWVWMSLILMMGGLALVQPRSG